MTTCCNRKIETCWVSSWHHQLPLFSELVLPFGAPMLAWESMQLKIWTICSPCFYFCLVNVWDKWRCRKWGSFCLQVVWLLAVESVWIQQCNHVLWPKTLLSSSPVTEMIVCFMLQSKANHVIYLTSKMWYGTPG